MPIIEVIPGAKFGALTVKGREGSFNGEATWRCEDEKERSVVFLESEIMAMYVEPVKVVPDVEPETDAEDAKEEEVKAPDDSLAGAEAESEKPEGESETVDGDPDTDCDEVPGGAAVAQSEPEQEKEEAREETPAPEAKKSFFSKNKKKKR